VPIAASSAKMAIEDIKKHNLLVHAGAAFRSCIFDCDGVSESQGTVKRMSVSEEKKNG